MDGDQATPCRLQDQPDADLAVQAAMYRLLVENTIDLIIRYDADRRRTYVSPSALEMLGYQPAEMMHAETSRLLHPDDHDWAEPYFQRLGPLHPRFTLTFRVYRKDGGVIWVEAQHRYLQEDGGAIAFFRDVTARKEAELLLEAANAKLEIANSVLQTLAQQDGLTGLANRRRFDEMLDGEFRRARRHELPLGLILIDVDCFKAFNDRYGHIAGDDCLRRIARAIEGVLRRPGDEIARYGGEEFVAVLPSTDHVGTEQVAEWIRRAVADLGITHSGSPHGIATVSAGTSSLIPFECHAPADLIEAADRALYEAKADGRNRVRGGVLSSRVRHSA